MKTYLAPIPKRHQRAILEMMGKARASQQAMQEFATTTDIEWRDVPLKARVLRTIACTAWEAVDYLRHVGVKFPGTVSEAAVVVTGTAYASWRASMNCAKREPDGPYESAMTGLFHGITFAMGHRCGIPAMYRADYLRAIAGSDDPIDRRPLWDTLAEVWPAQFGKRRITTFRHDGRRPNWAQPGDAAWGFDDDCWSNEPNILDDVTTTTAPTK